MELPEFLCIFAVTKSGCRFLEVRGARVRGYEICNMAPKHFSNP